MKIFIIAFLFIMATIFPILFFPLLALTLIILLGSSPYVATHKIGFFADEKENRLLHH